MIQKIKLVVVGKIKERYISEGIKEYEKRISPFCRLETIELKDEGIKKEAEKLEKYVSPNTFILDSKGTELSSEGFSEFLKKKDGEMVFIIGSSDGILPELKKKAKLISLSKMTFLHEMCRLFLLEQIYRGFMIIHGREYHK